MQPGEPVRVVASTMVSYRADTSVVERASGEAYRSSGLAPSEIDVFQLHDACAFAELTQAEPGKGASAALDGRTGPGGDAPVNTDGGLLSRGHALGATGLAQLAECGRQLRGEAGPRQLDRPRHAQAVNSGGWMGGNYATSIATLLTSA